MKLLLANSYFLENDPNERKIMKPYPPLGLLYVASALKEAGHEVGVFDGTFRSPSEFRRELQAFQPDLVGVYANVITRDVSLQLLAQARELGRASIVGGPDPTGDGDAYLAAGALAVVRGEGEDTARELVAHLEREGFDADLRGIPGLRLARNGDAENTAARDRISALDDLPHPDRDLIGIDQYMEAWKRRHGHSSVSLIASRGCPYHCTWCSREVFGGTVRQRSPESVLEEIELITERYQPDQLWFADDVLTLNRKWILEVARGMKERGLARRFECLSRVDRVDEEVVEALKEAGCFRLWYGAESGSEKMVQAMHKGFTVEKVRESVALTMDKGIEAGLFILIGYPGERVRDLFRTLKMIRELRPHYCGGSVAFPIKGTPFYEEVRHLLSDDYAWSSRNENRLSFRGRYPRVFYWFATRLLHNWSSYYSVRSRNDPLSKRLLHALKFVVAGAGTAGVGLLWELKEKLRPGRD